MWLFFLFVAIPLIEIALFIQVGGWLGTLPTIASIIITAAIGTLLVRQQGLSTLKDLQRGPQTQERVTSGLIGGAVILVAGLLLLTPGFFTDAVGFLCLIPQSRQWLGKQVESKMTVVQPAPGQPSWSPSTAMNDDVVEGEWTEADVSASATKPKNGSGWTKRPDT